MKPQVASVVATDNQIISHEKAELAGVSTLGMTEHQYKWLSDACDRVQKLDDQNRKLKGLILQLKKDDLIA